MLRKIISALAVLCALAAPVQAQKTKAALVTEITTNWPDNTSGAITPAILRSTVIDIVNSYYDLAGNTSAPCAAHQWVAALPTLSSISCTQPAIGDLASIAANSVVGSIAGGTPAALTSTQLTALLNLATTSLPGALPAWPNNTTTFFRGDGTYVPLNVAAVGGFGTGVATALGVNVGSAGAPVLFNGAGGTPTSLTLTNATGLPASGLTGQVAVANGGTACATASGTCLDNITGFSSTGYQNRTGAGTYAFNPAATAAQYFAGTASKVVESGVIYQAETTTSFAATTVFDFSTFINTAVTLTGNITTQTLSNVKAGQAGTIAFIQDGTGSRTTVWNSIFKFTGGATPTLTTTAAAVDVLSYSCRSASFCVASLLANVK